MKKTIKIEGMTCEHCSMKIKENLSEICGVSEVKVNLNLQTAEVQLAHDVETKKFEDKINSLGYKYQGII
ncbi:MAG: heavy-metal-associated domain-containing protein [Candidatus Izemoplasmataceae bacterium]|jgi:copper ion binding protein